MNKTNQIIHKLAGKAVVFLLLGVLLIPIAGITTYMTPGVNPVLEAINSALPPALLTIIVTLFGLSAVSWYVTPPDRDDVERVE